MTYMKYKLSEFLGVTLEVPLNKVTDGKRFFKVVSSSVFKSRYIEYLDPQNISRSLDSTASSCY